MKCHSLLAQKSIAYLAIAICCLTLNLFAADEDAQQKKLVRKLDEIVIPAIAFSNATAVDVFEFLSTESKRLDPEGQGVRIILKQGDYDAPMLTLRLVNTRLIDALREITSYTDSIFRYESNAVVISKVDFDHTHSVQGRQQEDPSRIREDELQKNKILEKLNTIVLSNCRFQDASVVDVVNFLNDEGRRLDPERDGVIIVFAAGVDPGTKVTLDCSNISLAEVLKRIAQSAHLKYQIEPRAVLLIPEKSGDSSQRGDTTHEP